MAIGSLIRRIDIGANCSVAVSSYGWYGVHYGVLMCHLSFDTDHRLSQSTQRQLGEGLDLNGPNSTRVHTEVANVRPRVYASKTLSIAWSPLICDGLRRRPGEVGDTGYTAPESSATERLRPPPPPPLPPPGETVESRGTKPPDDSRDTDPRGFPLPPYLGLGRVGLGRRGWMRDEREGRMASGRQRWVSIAQRRRCWQAVLAWGRAPQCDRGPRANDRGTLFLPPKPTRCMCVEGGGGRRRRHFGSSPSALTTQFRAAGTIKPPSMIWVGWYMSSGSEISENCG